MDEQQLIKKLRRGEVEAYEYLFKEYYEWLCNYVFRISGNRNLSKDIVQEVMVRFWEKKKEVVVRESLKGYLIKASHNQFLQHLRKEKKQPDLLNKIRWDTILDSYFERKEDDLHVKSALLKLDELIEMLPPKCKEIFIMNKLERRKYREIAQDMGISIKTVENQMSKALRIIRENASVLLLWFFL
ncbi:MAG: RNA polymerase sigma-70 factor [Allomuricauda sp.]|uniref:RNA polymerase sigma factor n=1 Tax=Sinomicrobium oceani TaxID=1150368 RepID=UPI00227C3C6C|nr:RNA polymerase sigma-70 factor [Sinomicrobium oceani]